MDQRANLADPDDVFFLWCANTDPGRDLHARDGRVGFDATAKVPGDERGGQPVRPFPPPQLLSEEVVRLVKERWEQYGFGR